MNKTPAQKMEIAAATLLRDLPFFGIMLFRMNIVAAHSVRGRSIKTMATDGKSIWYNPQWVDRLAQPEVTGVLLHEVLHTSNGHHLRAGGRAHRLWNKACDYAINPIVLANNLLIPAGGLLNSQWKDWSAEEVYEQLKAELPPPPPPGQGKPCDDGDEGEDGEGKSKKAKADADDADDNTDNTDNQEEDDAHDDDDDEAEADDDGADADDADDVVDAEADSDGADDAPDHDVQQGHGEEDRDGGSKEEEQDRQDDEGLILEPLNDEGMPLSPAEIAEEMTKLQIAIIQAASACKNAGILPAGAAQLVQEAKHPREDWRDVLRRFVSEAVETPVDQTWARCNRRFVSSGTYLPGWRKEDANKLLIVIDSSGSTFFTPALPRFFTEMKRILEDTQPEEVALVVCDTQVRFAQVFQKGEEVPQICPGGGGTAFSPVWRHVREMDFKPSGCVFFTDLECWDWGKDPGFPVLWAKWGHAHKRPPFGDVLDINQP